MKRTDLRRTKPMPRGKPIARSQWRRNVANGVANIPKTIPRNVTRRRTGFDLATRALVRDRDRVCQGCGISPAEAQRRGLRLEVHHRLPAGRGGPDTASNGLLICGLGNLAGCHRRVDQERLTWALPRGLVLVTGADPATVPVQDWADRVWLLDDHGQRRAA